MPGVYLQAPLRRSMLDKVRRWSDEVDKPPRGRETVWAVVDGAFLEATDAHALEAVYGPPVRAFESTEMAPYEELGLLLWRWADVDVRDHAELLASVMADRPGIVFVRSWVEVGELSRALAWMAAVRTDDGLALYLRIGDSRILSTTLSLLNRDQLARIGTAIREWVWPDRAGQPCSLLIDTAPGDAPLSEVLVLDGLQYAAMLDAAEVDLMYRRLCDAEFDWPDDVDAPALYARLQAVLQRCDALGLSHHSDRFAFVSLALRIGGKFEEATDLGETWLRVRSGASSLTREIDAWTALQWRAVQAYWQKAV